MRTRLESGIRSRHAQRGATLMIMVIVMVTGLTTLLVRSLSIVDIRNERQAKTSAALAQAKDALIGYAITYGDTHVGEVHGYLPCPDIDGKDISGNPAEGSAKANCGNKNVSQIGRLPWRTLNLAPLRDGDSECLWYAVSGTYKNNPQTGLMNWDNNGQFQAYAADGTRLDSNNSQIVAVIFAPGTARDGQGRSGGGAPICGGNYNASAYLDSNTTHGINNANINTVASAVSKFIQGENDGEVNDRMVFITRQDLWNAMLKRSDFIQTLKDMTRAVAECLASYGHNNDNPDNDSLPWPALLSLSDYAINDNYNDDDNTYAGRVPHQVYTSKSDSDNDMSGYRLMTSGNGLNCPHYDATPSNELERLYPWWNNWKDHLFYALSEEYRPRPNDTGSCVGDCVWLRNNGHRYAAIVLFAGSALSGRDRASISTSNTERGQLAKYLEGLNLDSYPNYGGDNEYEAGDTTDSFNDILYCIDSGSSLNVEECPLS
jgi:type II secretory pathway pseudopilin PulG